MAFTAGTVKYDFVADTDKLDRSSLKAVKMLGKSGKAGSTKFAKEFDGRKLGETMVSGMAAGVKSGAPKLKSALKATTALATAGIGIAGGLFAVGKAALRSAADINTLANQSGTSVEAFQRMAIAAKRYNIEQDKTGDILKDVGDKFGDFFATGAGPLVDFFDNIAPKVGVTADAFRGLSSDQALGLYVKTLERAGVNQQDFTFYMEAIADDATALLPILRDDARMLKEIGDEAQAAGRILSTDAAQGAFDLNARLEDLGSTLKDNLVRGIAENADQIEALTNSLIDMLPNIISWAGNIATGIDNLASSIERVEDIYQASFLGSKKKDRDPVNAKKAGERLQSVAALKEQYGIRQDRNGGVLRALNTKHLDAVDKSDQLSVKLFGKSIKDLEKEGVDVRKAIMDEYNRTADLYVKLQAGSGPSSSPSTSKPSGLTARNTYIPPALDPKSTATKSTRTASTQSVLGDDFKASLEESRRQLEAAEQLRDDNLTALERYQGELAAINAVALNPFLLTGDDGEETIMRARIQSLMDLASASDDVGAAHTALAQAIDNGTLTTDAALEAATRLNAEFGIFTKAELAARDAVQEKNDELLRQIEYQRTLAEASDDYTEVTRLTRELEVLRQKGDLLRTNIALTEAEAQARAQADVNALSKAQDLAGFDALDADTGNGLDAEIARIDEREQAKLELLESYRNAETEALRDFNALQKEIQAEADQERFELKARSLDDQLALAEGVFGGISDLLKKAGKEDSKAAKVAAKIEKGIALARATVFTALGVSRALASAPPPLNFVNAALVGAAGAVQIATIAQSFEGGGFTGSGPRSGGLDGKGGFMAMVHPNESIIDHTMPDALAGMMNRLPTIPSMNAQAADIGAGAMSAAPNITQNFQISGVDTRRAFEYVDEKTAKTERKVPGITQAAQERAQRRRPR